MTKEATWNSTKGERPAGALSQTEIVEIHTYFAQGGKKKPARVAEEYGVDRRTVINIKNGTKKYAGLVKQIQTNAGRECQAGETTGENIGGQNDPQLRC